MNNKYEKLSNKELMEEWNRNFEESELILQEVLDRKEKGTLDKENDPFNHDLGKKFNSHELLSKKPSSFNQNWHTTDYTEKSHKIN